MIGSVLRAAAITAALALTPAAPAVASGSIAGSAAGGSDRDQGPTPLLDLVDAADFAKQIERDLAARGARVAIVFRAGRARSDMPEGIRYTHGAFWVYSTVTTEDGRQVPGYAVYNLYSGAEGDPLRSYLHQDFPFDFTAAMAVGEAGIIVPSPEMQRRVLAIMSSPDYNRLHQPNYSLISNPHDLRYQNCNEFMLHVIASAAWETTDRPQIAANLTAHFEPTPINTNLFERVFAPIADSRLRTSDHSGGIRTTTFASLGEFMDEFGLADAVYELEFDLEAAEAERREAEAEAEAEADDSQAG